MPNTEGKEAVKFTEKHKDYKRGAFYWLDPKEATSYVDKGVAEKYDPNNPKEESPLPDLPGKDDFEEAGLSLEEIVELYEDGKLQSVDGIGPKTEEDLNQYFLNQDNDE